MRIEEDRQWLLAVPPAIIGFAIVFWGIMIEQLLLGICLAFFVEGYNFIKTRWKFTYANYVRAWHLSVIFVFVGAALYWIDGYKLTQMRVMFQWLPLVFSPMIFVQRYGEDDSMPLNTFSFMARKRMKADLHEGRMIEPYMIDFSSPYLGMCLISAGLVRRPANFWDLFSMNTLVFYGIGLAIILGMFLFSLGRKKGQGAVSFVIVYSLMLATGIWLTNSLVHLEHRVRGGMAAEDDIDIEESHTKIGNLTDLKLSKKVVWRMWVPEGEPVPHRIPLAVFDYYQNGIWLIHQTGTKNEKTRFSEASVLPGDYGDVFIFNESLKLWAASAKPEKAYRFLSTMKSNKPVATLPHLSSYVSYGGIVGKEALLKRNLLGSVRIDNPEATLHCLVWKNPHGYSHFRSPDFRTDRHVSSTERIAVSQICKKLELQKYSDAEKVDKLRNYFNNEFSYTTHLEIDSEGDENAYGFGVQSPLSRFLLDVKKGHCEYFATATAMILREAGVPTRYVTGYVSSEEVREGAHILRGGQAHAWCKAWIDNKWVDVDLTPPDWREQDLADSPGFQDKLADMWKMWREDFQVWRSDPENAKTVNRGILALGALVVLWILIRLWFAKNKKKNALGDDSYTLPPWKIMRKLDRWCTKLVGARPVGMTYGEWILQVAEARPEKTDTVSKFVECYRSARFNAQERDEEIEKYAREMMSK